MNHLRIRKKLPQALVGTCEVTATWHKMNTDAANPTERLKIPLEESNVNGTLRMRLRERDANGLTLRKCSKVTVKDRKKLHEDVVVELNMNMTAINPFERLNAPLEDSN